MEKRDFEKYISKVKIQCTKIIINVDQLSKLINGEEGKYRSLEVRARSSHLKRKMNLMRKLLSLNFEF